MHVERVIAQYLDEHLYNDGRFSKHERTDNRDEQLSGSDIILSIPSLGIKDAIVDEKAITHYMIRQLPTFALELSFLSQNGAVVEGWLTDAKKVTEYYLMMWPVASKPWTIEIEDIKHIDYMLVKRSDIIDWLANQGYTIDKLKEKANIIRSTVTENGAIDKVNGKDFWFFLTTKLAECPINVVIRKKVYESLALMKGTI
jgi:hypothetical protein